MRSRAKQAVLISAATAMAAGLVVVPAGPASATVYSGKRSVRAWGVIGKLDIDHRGKGKWYARGRFYNTEEYNAEFHVYLQRKKGKGGWKRVGYVGLLQNNIDKYSTGWAWDGKGYQTRVCIAGQDGGGYFGTRCSRSY